MSDANDETSGELAGYSRHIRRLFDGRPVASLAPERRLVFALIYRTLSVYTRRGLRPGVVWLPLVLELVTGLLIGYLVVAMPALLFRMFQVARFDGALYAITAVTLFAAYFTRYRVDTKSIAFSRGKIRDRFQLGRLERIFGPNVLKSLTRSVGLLFGLQTAVIQFTHDHLGLEGAASVGRSILLTLDNLFYGLLLDFCELYGIGLLDPVEHSWLSGTVFLFFRIGFDLMLVLIGYIVYQRVTMAGFLKNFPTSSEPSPAELSAWIEQTRIDKQAWIQHFSDEIIFLMVVDDYIRGDDIGVRQLGQQWPHLRVQPAVRQLFVDDAGKVVYSAEAVDIVDFS